jgi:hypothetical protein
MFRLALASLVMAACTTNNTTNNGGGGDDTLPDGGTSQHSTAPHDGIWHYDQITPTQNTCGQVLGRTDSGNYTISSSSSSGFHVTTSSESFDCVLSTSGFTCPDRAAITTDAHDDGFDAVFTSKADADGAFSDGDHGSGHQTLHVTCQGSQCAAAAAAVGASIPCDVSVAFTTSRG